MSDRGSLGFDGYVQATINGECYNGAKVWAEADATAFNCPNLVLLEAFTGTQTKFLSTNNWPYNFTDEAVTAESDEYDSFGVLWYTAWAENWCDGYGRSYFIPGDLPCPGTPIGPAPDPYNP